MKKQSVKSFLILLATSYIFFSCSNITNKHAETLKFDSIQVNQTVHLFGDTAKPACNLVINFTYISQAADTAMQKQLNAFFLSKCFGEEYTDVTSPEKAAEMYAQKYTSDYRKDLEPMYQKEEKYQNLDNNMSPGAWYSYYKNVESHIQSLSKQLLVYKLRYEEYTGGAHGVYMNYFYNIDLRTLKPLRLEDIFVKDYQTPLTQLLWNQLMADNNASSKQELEDLGFGTTGELMPTENFYLTAKGITFLYNIYEIAPYVMGAIEISLPWDALAEIKNSQFDIKP